MRKVELLISQSRRATENLTYSDTAGLGDEEFLQYLNDAQDRLQSLILQVHPEIFLKEKEIDAVNNQEAYSIPSDCYMGTRIEFIEYSQSGNSRDYYGLRQLRPRERLTAETGSPWGYIRRGAQFLVQPAPSSGKMRVSYYYKIPRLDKRRGEVSAVTLTGSSITSLTLDSSGLTAEDITDIEAEGYLTVIDKDGVVQMEGIPIADIDATTGVVTLNGSFSFQTGETISVGDYVVRGKQASTHSALPDMCERYLIAFCDLKILKRDSSNDAQGQAAEVQAMEEEILNSFREADLDVDRIPIISDEFLYPDEP